MLKQRQVQTTEHTAISRVQHMHSRDIKKSHASAVASRKAELHITPTVVVKKHRSVRQN